MASIIVELKKSEAIMTFPRVGHLAKLSKELVQAGDQEPNGHSNRTSVVFCRDGRTCQRMLGQALNYNYLGEAWWWQSHSVV